MPFPYFELLIVNATGDNECPCCGELDAGPHVYDWDLHKTEKSEWFQKLESIGGGSPSFMLTKEEEAEIDKMMAEATDEQHDEMNLWHGSSADIGDGAISLMLGPGHSDDFKEGFTVMLANSIWSKDYWGEWDCEVDVIKETHIGGLDIDQDKLDNWKQILEQLEETK